MKVHSPDFLIQYILDQKLAKSTYDKFLNEQMINITDLGIEINQILNKLKETSKEANETNELVAEKLKENEKNEL
jgi:lipoate-protein ligase A